VNRRRFIRIVAFVALIATGPLFGATVAKRLVVFHTDIGTDIDDTWALAQLLRSPELDLKFVLTDTGDTRHRAVIVAKLLEIAGRTDVAIGIGLPGSTEQQPRNQEPWTKGYDLARYPGHVSDDGVGALIDFVMRAEQPVTIVSVSAVSSLAAALEREPKLAARCRFVGMHGSVDVGYGDKPPAAAEWNVKVDPAALRKVLSAPWQDVLLTPLDTCGSVSLSGADYHAIWSATTDPLLRALIENYCIFAPRVTWMNCDFFATRSTTLFDCVAVYLAGDERLVETEPVHLRVTDDGFTVRDSVGPAARVALRWKDRAAFEHQLAQRLLNGGSIGH
jgi:inosine-uridine nucleoside N-ribohydrolase